MKTKHPSTKPATAPIRISVESKRRLDFLSLTTGRTRFHIANEAIAEYVEQQSGKGKK